MSNLPTDAKARKSIPLSAVVDYFPAAFIELAKLCLAGNNQHHPGAALWWDRSKSSDHDDALLRHFLERDTKDTDGVWHRTKVAWRALAALQHALERDEGYPEPRGAKPATTVTEAANAMLASGSIGVEALRQAVERVDEE